MLRQGCRGRPLGWRRVFLLRSGAGMCARRRSNLSLASPPVAGREKVTKEKATPLSVSPSLRYGATCGAPFRRGPRKLASLRCAQTARGPDPPEAVLLGTARGEGEPGSPSGHRCARPRRRQRARRRQWRRIQRSAGIGGAVQLSDHDAAQRNACSDPNAGMVGAARVLCHSCFRPCIALEMMSDCCRP